jgi:hypothetical protein
MKATNDFEDARVEAFLAPLSKLAPATRRACRPLRVSRLALALAGGLLLAGGVAVAATNVFGPLHDVNGTPDPSPLTCSGLVGAPATDAASYLEAHGYQVSWRFLTYSDTALSQPHGSTPGAVEGHSQIVPGPPPGSVVSNLGPLPDDPTTVIVFTQAANDPNAPQIGSPNCASRK